MENHDRRTLLDLEPKSKRELAPVEETGKMIDEVLKSCLPLMSDEINEVSKSLVIAKTVTDLKNIMLNSPAIKALITGLTNTRVGFMTDRTPAALARNKRENKHPQDPYTYEEILNAVIEGLLKGYRLTNNEMNVIAGQFYAAKNGNYRMIKSYPGVTDFQYNNEPVAAPNAAQFAQVKCWARWKLDGKQMSIGLNQDDHCVIGVRINYGMGEDGILGKAHAKLFRRVLERISGKISSPAAEVDDIPEAETMPATPEKPEDPEDAPPNGNSKVWNPISSPLQSRYGREKAEILKSVAESMKIKIDGKWPRDVHQMILAEVEKAPREDGVEDDQQYPPEGDQEPENGPEGAGGDQEPPEDGPADQEPPEGDQEPENAGGGCQATRQAAPEMEQ